MKRLLLSTIGLLSLELGISGKYNIQKDIDMVTLIANIVLIVMLTLSVGFTLFCIIGCAYSYLQDYKRCARLKLRDKEILNNYYKRISL